MKWYSKSIIIQINCAAEIPQEVGVIFIINRYSETKVTKLNQFSQLIIPTTQSMNEFSVFCSCWMNENVLFTGTFKTDDEVLSI